MRKRNYKYSGFSLLEISVVVAILSIFSAIAFWNLTSLISRSRAKECSGNLIMLNQAVNNYCLDNNIPYGTGVQMSNMISQGYLKANEIYVCPVNNTPYQTTFTYGTKPVCPDGLLNHECTTD